jgi:hypothetical protein
VQQTAKSEATIRGIDGDLQKVDSSGYRITLNDRAGCLNKRVWMRSRKLLVFPGSALSIDPLAISRNCSRAASWSSLISLGENVGIGIIF